MLYVKRKGKENATHCEAEIISHVDNEREAGRLRNKGGTRGQHRSLGVSKAVLSHSPGAREDALTAPTGSAYGSCDWGGAKGSSPSPALVHACLTAWNALPHPVCLENAPPWLKRQCKRHLLWGKILDPQARNAALPPTPFLGHHGTCNYGKGFQVHLLTEQVGRSANSV